MKITQCLLLLLFLTSSNAGPIDKEFVSSKMDKAEHSVQQEQACCPIVELRRYELHPRKRDVLIELFDREFVESQEAVGIRVLGQFRDLDDANQFVWLRGFPDMSKRAQALKDFYGGPVWKKHREAANATMVDSDNVLLLRPAGPNLGFFLKNADALPAGAKTVAEQLVVATIYYLDQPADVSFVELFESAIKRILGDAGASILAYFVTENSTNNFPALPVREGLHVFVWFARFQNIAAYKDYEGSFERSPRWNKEISGYLANHLRSSPEVLKLSPTARSHVGNSL